MQGKWLKQKNILVAVVFGLALITFFVLFNPSAFAGNVDLGLDTAATIGLGNVELQTLIVRIVRIFLGFLGLLAVIMILYGGYIWMTAGGSPDKIEKAKKILRNAGIGLLIIIMSFSIAEFIFRQLGWATGLDQNGRFDQSYQYSGGIGGGAIKSHYPPRGAIGVARNVSIVVTFKEKIDRSTIYNQSTGYLISNVVIEDADGNQNSSVKAITEDDNTFVLTSDNYLGRDDTNVVYTVTLTSDILKQNGDPVFGATGSYEWQFTVSTIIDLTPPKVVGVFPIPDKTYARNAVVQINFNEPINPLSASGEVANGFNKIVAQALGVSTPINGTFNIVNQYRTIEFITSDLCGRNSCGYDVFCLPGDKDITVLIKAATLATPGKPTAVIPFNGVVDMANNSLDGNSNGQAEGETIDNYQWQFKTSGLIDLNPPSVTGVTPGVSTVNVGTRSLVKSNFNKLMMYSTLNAENIMIDQNTYYWITSFNDPAAFTVSVINHDEFTEFTPYHPLITNKCMDVFQNCFNPAAGPSDFKVGGTDANVGWLAGTISGNANLTQVPGQLRINMSEIETPYVWIARSNLNEVVRVSTQTGAVSAPVAVGTNPSRTSVDGSSRVWIANRDSCNVTVLYTDSSGNIKYVKGTQVNSTFLTTPACGPRGVAVDADGNIWIAGGSQIVKLSGQDADLGTKLATVAPNAGSFAYGAAIDKFNRLWVVFRDSGKAAVIDVGTGTVLGTPQVGDVGQLYGLATDPEGNIWVDNSWGSATVSKVDGNSANFTFVKYNTGGATPRGVAMDKEGNIWVTNWNSNNVTKLKQDGTILNIFTSGSGPLGISGDAGGHMWVVNYNGGGPAQKYTTCSGGTVTKFNIADGSVDGTYCVGGQPYTYSDMTGFGFKSVVHSLVTGQWLSPVLDMHQPVVVTGLFAHGDFPVGTAVELEGRSATTQAGLATATWQKAQADGLVQLTQGSWLQIRATLKTSRVDQTPSLNNISISISGQ
ncbi:MAG: hypothetical protein COX77_04360 [Candidatus Komeilibacteria bacterium CG_4_10_14_0_2_um_filter_37_10]|uniref:SbsA Ig-like domain-containing protein n=1 Tax=Candidatus Komeilibacteria bacterium CG_4_10_14_0_2_um_filter_37_10 TaxID=1974470 RepID=A0A2M7VDH1_9BACT|nr:MAG: hypothetical protein COX77_04360 [Candidatus Komeilibacteria bacterium CG_4_10_14_0_2_um_filter_37_10]